MLDGRVMVGLALAAVALWMAPAARAATAPLGLPGPTIPDGLGVNIHFRGEPARDIDMLAAAGFRFIRMDFAWHLIERERGVYDFTAYDQLTDGLARRGLRPLYILDYSNPLYEEERSVQTEAGRQAFARFAAAGAARYRGRGVVWELWNEPNGSFWRPQPAIDGYMALAKVALPAVRRADPAAVCIAPACAGIDRSFLQGCAQRGLFDLVDGVSVHPYRQAPPETAAADYAWLRGLIDSYRPGLPIVSGEWGYSSAWSGFDVGRQGQYLPRELLTNLSLGIPLAIWYDWHDDGPDPKEPEHHFGTVTLDYRPKPAYLAMQRLTRALSGLHFVKRLGSAPDDYRLLFTDGNRSVLAVWTTGADHEAEVLPGQTVLLDGHPLYLGVPPGEQRTLAEGAWSAPMTVSYHGGVPAGQPGAPAFEVTVRNPFDTPLTASFSTDLPAGLAGGFVGRSGFRLAPGESRRLRWQGTTNLRRDEELALTVTAVVAGHRSSSTVSLQCANPVHVAPALLRDGSLAVAVDNGWGDDFRGTLAVQDAVYPMTLHAGQVEVRPAGGGEPFPTESDGRATFVRLPVHPVGSFSLALQQGGQTVTGGRWRVEPLPITTATVHPVSDGDPTVPASYQLTDNADGSLHFAYDYAEGWKFVRIAPRARALLEGRPHEIGVWVRGEGAGCTMNMRYRSDAGRTWQPNYGALGFTGWRYFRAVLDDKNTYSWGAAPGDHITWPIAVDTYILVAGPGQPVKGEVDFAAFQLIYRE